jgi:hypothetical protein
MHRENFRRDVESHTAEVDKVVATAHARARNKGFWWNKGLSPINTKKYVQSQVQTFQKPFWVSGGIAPQVKEAAKLVRDTKQAMRHECREHIRKVQSELTMQVRRARGHGIVNANRYRREKISEVEKDANRYKREKISELEKIENVLAKLKSVR